MTAALATAQGLIQLLGLVFFSILAWWRLNSVLFMITGALALLTGCYAPDIFTGGTTTDWSLNMGIMMMAYGFLCLGLAYKLMLQKEKAEEPMEEE